MSTQSDGIVNYIQKIWADVPMPESLLRQTIKKEDNMQKTTVTVKREEYSISNVEVRRALCRVVGIPEHDYEQITINKDGSANYVFETSNSTEHN